MKDYILDRFREETKYLRKSYFGEIVIVFTLFIPQLLFWPVLFTIETTDSTMRVVIGAMIFIIVNILTGAILACVIRDARNYRRGLAFRREIEFLENYLCDEVGIRNRWALSYCIAGTLEYYPKSLVIYPGISASEMSSLISDKEPIFTSIWHELADKGAKSDTVTIVGGAKDTAIVYKIIDDYTIKIAFVFLPTGDYFTRSIDLKDCEILSSSILSKTDLAQNNYIFHSDLGLDNLGKIFD